VAGALLAGSTGARAEVPSVRAGGKAAPVPSVTTTTERLAPANWLGVMVDVGVPDGANAALVVRPTTFLQVHGGFGYNAISPGVRLGASAYLPWVVTPAVAVEAGRYFKGDANAAMARLGIADTDEPMLSEVGYDYANLHTGLNFGRDRMTFFIHAGWSAMRGTLSNTDQIMTESDNGITVEVRQDPIITLILPSAKLGLSVYF
jgi:hypothetical protein